MQNLDKIWNHSLITTKGGVLITVGDISLVIFLVFLSYVVSRFAENILAKKLAKTRIRADSVHVIKRVLFYSIFVLVGISILGILGIPITAFAFATGAIAIGIGFGAQNIINNFISGWILMAERPIRVDDFIEMDNWMGTVIRVGTRSTLIQRLDGVHILVPNSKLLENTLVNWTLLDGLIRTQVRVGVAYGSDVQKTLTCLLRAVKSTDSVLNTPEPEIIFEDFADSALVFDVYFWGDINQGKSLRMIRSLLRIEIEKALREEEIVIAFPQRDLHLHASQALPVNIESKSTKMRSSKEAN